MSQAFESFYPYGRIVLYRRHDFNLRIYNLCNCGVRISSSRLVLVFSGTEDERVRITLIRFSHYFILFFISM